MAYGDAELERVADLAAERAARKVADAAPSMDKIERLVEVVANRAAREAAAEAGKAAVAQTLIGFGLDPDNRAEIMKDFMFLSEMRSLSSASKRHVMLAVVGVLCTGVITAVVAYLKIGGKLP